MRYDTLWSNIKPAVETDYKKTTRALYTGTTTCRKKSNNVVKTLKNSWNIIKMMQESLKSKKIKQLHVYVHDNTWDGKNVHVYDTCKLLNKIQT